MRRGVPCPPWLERDFTYELLGYRRKYAEYQRYVEGEEEDSLAAFYDQTYLKPVLGSEEFLATLAKREKAASECLAKAQRMLPSLVTITQAVSSELGVPIKQIRQTVRGRGQRNEARWLAVCLCRDLGGYRLAEIATYFGMGHISGINQCVGKLRQALEEDLWLARAKNILSQVRWP